MAGYSGWVLGTQFRAAIVLRGGPYTTLPWRSRDPRLDSRLHQRRATVSVKSNREAEGRSRSRTAKSKSNFVTGIPYCSERSYDRKFEQSRSLRDELLSTGDNTLVECTADGFWGAGCSIDSRHLDNHSFKGRNTTGILLKRRAQAITSDHCHSRSALDK